MGQKETLEGYVVDLMCLRQYPQDELFERGRAHTKRCAMMGHCIESGYGLVDQRGRLTLLEPSATSQVLAAVRASDRDHGIWLRAVRELEDGDMVTQEVIEAAP